MAGYELVIGRYNVSSRSLVAWVALRLAGVPFAVTSLDTADPGTAERIAQTFPGGRLPVLRADGETIAWETTAILEVAAEHEPGLWPQDARARARARSIAGEVAGLGDLHLFLPMDFSARFGPPGKLLQGVARDIDRVCAIWRESLARAAEHGRFLFGSVSLADAMMVPVAARFRTYAIELDEPCRAYAEALLALAPVLEWERAALAETQAGMVLPAEVGARRVGAGTGERAKEAITPPVQWQAEGPLQGEEKASAAGDAAAPPPAAEPAQPRDIRPSEPERRRPLFVKGSLFRSRRDEDERPRPAPREPAVPADPPPAPSSAAGRSSEPSPPGEAIPEHERAAARHRQGPPVKPIGTGIRRRR